MASRSDGPRIIKKYGNRRLYDTRSSGYITQEELTERIRGGDEVQVLDVYNNKTYADGQAGGLYGMWPPLQNAMKAPGEFNTYDIIFESAQWDTAGNLTRQASVTVIHNGVVLHHKQQFTGPTGHRNVLPNTPYSGMGGIRLQDHGDAVRYRNIWIRPLGEYDRPETH